MIDGIRFIDANVLAGPRLKPYPHRDDTVAGLITRMDRTGIDEAYVTHASCLEYDPVEGNRRILNEAAAEARLHPVWVLVPASSGEMPPPAEAIPAMREAGVRMVRFYPGRHYFAFDEWNVGDWLDMLAEHRVPVMFDFTDFANWEALYRAGAGRPGLPVILSRTAYRIDREVFRLMEDVPNFFLETCTYKTHLGVERVVSRFGEGRLVFGSFMTEFAPRPAMATVMRADISEEAKRAIAGENLERMVSAVEW